MGFGWRRYAALTGALMAAMPLHAQIDSAIVSGGAIEGKAVDGIGVFKGIPFAAPPVGDLRWKAPAPVIPWSGVRQTVDYAPACMQDPQMMRNWGDDIAISEDCLYANVWTPAKSADEKLPVMVWIYGGGFAIGATSGQLYRGTHLARRGVIVVGIAYRLGPLGFAAHPALSAEQGGVSGNYGLLDQIAGLKWVQENIAKFGGDPDNVTIFGESAGGIAVAMLAQSPLARGLFDKAISESGGNMAGARPDPGAGGMNMRSLPEVEAQGVDLFARLGAADLAAARALPADEVQKFGATMGDYWPNYDGKVLPRDGYAIYAAGDFNDTPVLIGTNSDEGALFMPPTVEPEAFIADIRAGYGPMADAILAAYPHGDPQAARQASADTMRETAFAWPTWAWANFQSSKGKGAAYVYYFDYRTAQSPNGTTHADEMQYVFGNPMVPGTQFNAEQKRLNDVVASYWTNFARTGDPNGPGLPLWPKYSAATPRYMKLGNSNEAIPVPHLDKIELWDRYYAWRREQAGE